MSSYFVYNAEFLALIYPIANIVSEFLNFLTIYPIKAIEQLVDK